MNRTTTTPEGKRSKQLAPRHGSARLTLFINSRPYSVKPLPTEGTEDVYKLFRLRSSEGKAYHVAQTSEGLTCDCPDFEFNRKDMDPAIVGKGCKHLLALKAVGILEDL